MLPERFQALRPVLGAWVAKHPAWVRMTRTALSTRFTKYALGSVVAFIASNVAFLKKQMSPAAGSGADHAALTDLAHVVLNLNEFVYLQ